MRTLNILIYCGNISKRTAGIIKQLAAYIYVVQFVWLRRRGMVITAWGGGGVLPYMGYIGMCGPKGYGFSAVLVINRVSIIAILPPLWS